MRAVVHRRNRGEEQEAQLPCAPHSDDLLGGGEHAGGGPFWQTPWPSAGGRRWSFCARGRNASRSTRWIRRPAPPPPLHPIPHTGGHHPTTPLLHHTILESVPALGQAWPVAAHGQLAPTAPSCRRTSRRDEPAFPCSGCRPTGYSSSAAYVERRVAQVVSVLQTTGM